MSSGGVHKPPYDNALIFAILFGEWSDPTPFIPDEALLSSNREDKPFGDSHGVCSAAIQSPVTLVFCFFLLFLDSTVAIGLGCVSIKAVLVVSSFSNTIRPGQK